jgi:hypothetical protein
MGLLRIYGIHLRSLFAYPEPDPTPDSDRGRESRAASATGRPQPESSPAATASARSILLDDSLATLEELAGGLDHRQTGDRYQMAQARLQALLALERNSPTPREIEAPEKGKVIAISQVGGLHHRYRRAA